MAPPFKLAEFDIMYGEGISYAGDILNTAIKLGVVNKSGNTYSFPAEGGSASGGEVINSASALKLLGRN